MAVTEQLVCLSVQTNHYMNCKSLLIIVHHIAYTLLWATAVHMPTRRPTATAITDRTFVSINAANLL